MRRNKGNNGTDDPEGQENGTWFCSACGTNASCAKGQESAALYVHQLAEHAHDNESDADET